MVEDASSLEPDRASLPSGGSVGCATCGNPVDPLRAEPHEGKVQLHS